MCFPVPILPSKCKHILTLLIAINNTPPTHTHRHTQRLPMDSHTFFAFITENQCLPHKGHWIQLNSNITPSASSYRSKQSREADTPQILEESIMWFCHQKQSSGAWRRLSSFNFLWNASVSSNWKKIIKTWNQSNMCYKNEM